MDWNSVTQLTALFAGGVVTAAVAPLLNQRFEGRNREQTKRQESLVAFSAGLRFAVVHFTEATEAFARIELGLPFTRPAPRLEVVECEHLLRVIGDDTLTEEFNGLRKLLTGFRRPESPADLERWYFADLVPAMEKQEEMIGRRLAELLRA